MNASLSLTHRFQDHEAPISYLSLSLFLPSLGCVHSPQAILASSPSRLLILMKLHAKRARTPSQALDDLEHTSLTRTSLSNHQRMRSRCMRSWQPSNSKFAIELAIDREAPALRADSSF
jgi:hypothetical protein